jgi:hypothetical protein
MRERRRALVVGQSNSVSSVARISAADNADSRLLLAAASDRTKGT